jgi:hypothetical protein
MPEKLKVLLRFPRLLFGSEEYSLVVEVTNLTDRVLTDLAVDRQLLPGVPLSVQENPSYSELDDLDNQKRQLVQELEALGEKAYERKRMRKMSAIEKLMLFYTNIPLITASIVTKSSSSIISLPRWARQASRIKEWPDVERLEELLIADEPEDSFLRKVFLLDKEKLRECLARIAQVRDSGNQQTNLSDTISIQPGETISFSFRYRAPHLYRQRIFDTQVRVSYKDPSSSVSGNYSLGETVSFGPSYFSVPVGAAIGATVGFVVRAVFLAQSSWGLKNFGAQLLGSILLALVVACFTARSSDSKKIITVEDFLGGFIIGALAGLFSEKFLQFLNAHVSSWLGKTG